MSEPAKSFYRSLSALGQRITETHEAVKASLSVEERNSFGEIFDAYSSLIEATEREDLIIGRAISDEELRARLADAARRSFRPKAA